MEAFTEKIIPNSDRSEKQTKWFFLSIGMFLWMTLLGILIAALLLLIAAYVRNIDANSMMHYISASDHIKQSYFLNSMAGKDQSSSSNSLTRLRRDAKGDDHGHNHPGEMCWDGRRNQDETDVDCGGICSKYGRKCNDKNGCKHNSDCKCNQCHNNHCNGGNRPTCTDGFQNEGETDVDCGGPCALRGYKCDHDDGCRINRDCKSNICRNRRCYGPPSCSDNIRNQGETGRDCGGPCVLQGKRCNNSDDCKINDDCKSNICTGGKCVPVPTTPPPKRTTPRRTPAPTTNAKQPTCSSCQVFTGDISGRTDSCTNFCLNLNGTHHCSGITTSKVGCISPRDCRFITGFYCCCK